MMRYFSLIIIIEIIVNIRVYSFSNGVTRRKMSWPFDKFDAPEILDGSLAGDAGFDPLGIAKDKESLFFLREGLL